MEATKKQNPNTLTQNKNLLWKSLFYRPHMRGLVFLLTLSASACSFSVIYFQKSFLNSLFKPDLSSYEAQIQFILMLFLFAISSHALNYLSKRISYFEATKLQRILAEKTYSKTLLLTTESSSKTNAGNLISLYATDVLSASSLIDDVFPNIISYLIPVILAPFALIFLTTIQPAWVVTAIFSILLMNCLIGIKQTQFYLRHKNLAAARMAFVNEWLQNIRTIRMLGWIAAMEGKIRQARKEETNNRLYMVTNGSTMNSIAYSSPFFINILALFILILVEKKAITPGDIFSLLWVFGVILTRPIRMFPMMLVSVGDCYTSFKRIEDYWSLASEPNSTDPPTGKHVLSPISSTQKMPANYGIHVTGMNLSLGGKQILHDIHLDIKPGEFVAIVGAIGSGKTALIQSLLKIYPASFDSYFIDNHDVEKMSLPQLRGLFSYVPQDFFVSNSNLRDNIALDYETDKKYDHDILNSLHLSQFKMNQENTKFTLDTEIGERGVNLSGGQKQRVTLARAHYFDRPIVILDDCLSALDIHTEEKINQSLLNGAWKQKTRILVTHRLSILPECDRVLVMEKGRIWERKG